MTALQFTTTDEIPNKQELAFIFTTEEGVTYLIVQREAPFQIVEITKKIHEDMNIYEIKVTFERKKTLIPYIV